MKHFVLLVIALLFFSCSPIEPEQKTWNIHLNDVELIGGELLDFGLLSLKEALDRGYILTVDVDIKSVSPCDGSRRPNPHSYSKKITREQVKNGVINIAVPVDARAYPYIITLTLEKTERVCLYDESIGEYVYYSWIELFESTDDNVLPPSSFYMPLRVSLCNESGDNGNGSIIIVVPASIKQ